MTPKNPEQYPVDLEFYSYYLMAIRDKLTTALKNGTSKLTINPDELANYPIEYFNMDYQLEKKKLVTARKASLQKLLNKLEKEKSLEYEGISNM